MNAFEKSHSVLHYDFQLNRPMKNTKTRFLAFVLAFMFLHLGAVAQECTHFERLIRQGDANFEKKDLAGAILKYQAAMADCSERESVAFERLKKAIALSNALMEENRAKKIENLALNNLVDTLNLANGALLEQVDSAHRTIAKIVAKVSNLEYLNQIVGGKVYSLVDSMQFETNPITLASKVIGGKIVYSYIDPKGQELSNLGNWKHATQFRDDDYATVQCDSGYFVIDKQGNQFPKSVDGFNREDLSVDCSFDNLDYLPRKIYKVSDLLILLANGNNIRRIKPKIKLLNSLIYINLSDNQLKKMKTLTGNPNLIKLSVEGNHIRKIPLKVISLDSLQSVEIGRNEIKKIPKAVYKMTRLKEIDLEYNRIRMLNKGLGQLRNLEMLELSFNQLTALPTELPLLTKLKYLGLTGNMIDNITEETFYALLQPLTNLKQLRIGSNPCSNTPEKQEAIRRRIMEILPNCRVILN
jgi:hypothetical protein